MNPIQKIYDSYVESKEAQETFVASQPKSFNPVIASLNASFGVGMSYLATNIVNGAAVSSLGGAAGMYAAAYIPTKLAVGSIKTALVWGEKKAEDLEKSDNPIMSGIGGAVKNTLGITNYALDVTSEVLDLPLRLAGRAANAALRTVQGKNPFDFSSSPHLFRPSRASMGGGLIAEKLTDVTTFIGTNAVRLTRGDELADEIAANNPPLKKLYMGKYLRMFDIFEKAFDEYESESHVVEGRSFDLGDNTRGPSGKDDEKEINSKNLR